MSKNRNRWMGWGLVLGAAAGLVYTYRRLQENTERGPSHMLDWQRVQEVAQRMARDSVIPSGQQSYYADLVSRSVHMISNYTRLQLPSDALNIRVMSQRHWLDTNLQSFQSVLEPLEELYQRAASGGGVLTTLVGSPVRNLLSRQVGLLLGYLSQRVLGQYDVALLGREPLHDGQLYFVEPNIRGVQAQLGLNGSDFPMWVALHESTHAFEFEVHPWLREHFNHLLREYLSELEPEIEHLSQHLSPAGLSNLLERIRAGDSWLLWALTPRQRELFEHMQALMCIVEGYSNHIMTQIGRQILPSFDLIESRVAARQAERSPAERLLARLIGLDLKMEQYKLGERFADVVAEQRGLAFLQQVWQRAEHLPSMDEIHHPERWIARLEEESA
ncbi:MAG: zinc-dependent metalloprotease [Chloroflexia bacterium]|nr:zinc-dependent metalloprotease [Chloroflexia bacterium]